MELGIFFGRWFYNYAAPTELETFVGWQFYKYAAPDGAVAARASGIGERA